MKAFQKITAAAAALLLCLCLCAPALAADAQTQDPDWDQITARLISEYGLPEESVYAGYLNLVTGEEHYHNGDEYFLAASMYKVPLCMYCSEHVADGSIDWSVYEQYFTYESVQDAILLDSSNEQATFLFNTFLGGYDNFRVLTADYMGIEPGSEPVSITMYNYYTAREFIQCLRLLYSDPGRFPGVLETMQKAMTDRFFKLNEPRFRIAHKPGWLEDYGVPVLNDCAICYTTQPIAIVMMTKSSNTSEEFLSAWCTAMCEYTETLANKPEPTPEPTPTPAPTEAPAPAETEPTPSRVALPMIVPAAAVGAFLLLGLILIITLCVKYRARFIGLFLALLLSAAAMLLAAAGMYIGTVYAKPDGDPAETVALFLDAVCAGDYAAAYRQLHDYSDLGLGERPASPAGQKVYDALHQSFSYELSGDCRTDKLDAKQKVRLRYLDLDRLDEAVAEETQRQAEKIVQNRPVNELYDADKRYLPEVANEAYLAALDVALQHAEDYYSESEFELSLAYTDSRWQLLASPALLRALAGGIAY